MSDGQPSRRRWLQFGLRELFWLTLVVATVLFAVRERERRIGLERDLAALRQEFKIEKEDAAARLEQSENEKNQIADVFERFRKQHEEKTMQGAAPPATESTK